MLEARDNNGIIISADEFTRDRDMYCLACGEPVNYRHCREKKDHFYHKNGNPTYECDNKMSKWHKDMQALVDKQYREIPLVDPLTNKKSRSDVLLGKTTIEFQYSPLPRDIFDTRVEVNRNLGNRILYVIDATEIVKEGRLNKGINDIWVWKRPYEYFKDLDIRGSWNEVAVYLDLDGKSFIRVVEIGVTNKEEKTCRLIRLASTSIEYAKKGYIRESDFFTEKIDDYPELNLFTYVKSNEYKDKSKCPIKSESDGIESIIRKIYPVNFQDIELSSTGVKELSRVKFDGSVVKEKANERFKYTAISGILSIMALEPTIDNLVKVGCFDYSGLYEIVSLYIRQKELGLLDRENTLAILLDLSKPIQSGLVSTYIDGNSRFFNSSNGIEPYISSQFAGIYKNEKAGRYTKLFVYDGNDKLYRAIGYGSGLKNIRCLSKAIDLRGVLNDKYPYLRLSELLSLSKDKFLKYKGVGVC